MAHIKKKKKKINKSRIISINPIPLISQGICILVLIKQLIEQKCEVLVESKFKSNEYCDVVWKELLIIQCN